jgi:hypothetical protein
VYVKQTTQGTCDGVLQPPERLTTFQDVVELHGVGSACLFIQSPCE